MEKKNIFNKCFNSLGTSKSKNSQPYSVDVMSHVSSCLSRIWCNFFCVSQNCFIAQLCLFRICSEEITVIILSNHLYIHNPPRATAVTDNRKHLLCQQWLKLGKLVQRTWEKNEHWGVLCELHSLCLEHLKWDDHKGSIHSTWKSVVLSPALLPHTHSHTAYYKEQKELTAYYPRLSMWHVWSWYFCSLSGYEDTYSNQMWRVYNHYHDITSHW